MSDFEVAFHKRWLGMLEPIVGLRSMRAPRSRGEPLAPLRQLHRVHLGDVQSRSEPRSIRTSIIDPINSRASTKGRWLR
jgi:hypothetical protein